MADQAVMTIDGENLRPSVLTDTAIQDLAGRLRGTVIRPGDGDYDAARSIWNAMIDKRPAVIARCLGPADVIASVQFARQYRLLVSVRGGGHHAGGFSLCDGGLVIDLSPMKGLRVDPVRQTVRAEPGATWGDFDRETAAFGLATPGGAVSTTGIAGLTLGGGVGWLSRKHGLTCDNLLSVDVVTAEGELLHASADENPDLFWGVRGGGGNFGIVTSFEYRLHSVAQVLAGPLIYPLDQAKDVLRFLADYLPTVPDELTVLTIFMTAAAGPLFPASLHGKLVVVPTVCFAGATEEGERVLKPLRNFGEPAADFIAPLPYVGLQSMFDAQVPPGLHSYWKSVYLGDLSPGAIDAIVECGASMTSPLSHLHLQQLGGATSRVGEQETVCGHRSAAFECYIEPVWEGNGPADPHIAWVRSSWSALQAFSPGAGYLNRSSDIEEQAALRSAYGIEKYDRLVALKEKYDPTNFFRLNHNVRPSL